MALDRLVEGPGWTGVGIEESAGRYPLRVETAVSRIVDRMLPGVITTTRHARMYTVHALAWAEAQARGCPAEDAAQLVRRCEAIVAAVHHLHEAHRISLSTAHGEDRVPRFRDDGRFDVAGAAARVTGLSRDGFRGVYVGPCVRVGLLSEGDPPRRGPRVDVDALRAGLEDLLHLANHDVVDEDELRAADHLCLCRAAEAPDGQFLRRVMFEEAEPDNADDRHRLLTTRLFLDILTEEGPDDITRAFREAVAYGPPPAGDDDLAMATRLWRAAALRNYSVSAWRELWWWLASELQDEPMTAQALGEHLAASFDDVTVAELLADLPPTADREILLPAEAEIHDSDDWSPLDAVRMLAVGAKRLDELDPTTLAAFVGDDPTDLGPRWVAGLLHEWSDRHVRDLGRELAVILVRRAQRVALSKMALVNGRPWVPTRLRDRDGLLSVKGEEGAGAVALRTETLTAVLAGVGIVERRDGGWHPSEYGRGLRGRLG